MTTGTRNVLLSPQGEDSAIKYISLVFLMSIAFSQKSNGMPLDSTRYIKNDKIFHQPAKVLFRSRAFDLEVFTDFEKKLIKEISLFCNFCFNLLWRLRGNRKNWCYRGLGFICGRLRSVCRRLTFVLF